MRRFSPNYLLKRLEDIETFLNEEPSSKLVQEDMIELVNEVFQGLGDWLDLPDLEKRLVAQVSVDTDALGRAIELLKQRELGDECNLGARIIEPKEALAKLEELVANLVENQAIASDFDKIVDVGLTGDALFLDILSCTLEDWNGEELVQMLVPKLGPVPEEQITHLWGQVRYEFELKGRDAHAMSLDEQVVDKDFLEFDSDPDRTRLKLAQYAAVVKPKLQRLMFAAGINSIPFNSPGVAQILASTEPAAFSAVSDIEKTIGRALPRTVAIAHGLGKSTAEFAKRLGLPPKSRIVVGPDFSALQSELQGLGVRRDRLLLYELRKLVRTGHELLSYETNLEIALRQHKLGLEVVAPDILREFRTKNELRLQRELCKFLLEKNIPTVGTKFGRSETDLVTQLSTDPVIIETKLFKNRPMPRDINTALVQLQSYLEQAFPAATRVVLLIYNTSDTVITTPEEWIRGRFWIIAVNLLSKPPSRLHRSLLIEPGQSRALVDIVITEPGKAKPKPPAKAKGKAKPKP